MANVAGQHGGAKKKSKKHSKKASKKHSKKASKKHSKKHSKKEQDGGAKKHSKKASKKASKKGSKKHSKKMSREMNPFMKNVMEIKAVIKKDDSNVKDGPALSSVVSAYLKSGGNVDKAVELYHKEKKSGDFKKKINESLDRMAKKRAEKKAAKANGPSRMLLTDSD